MELNWLAVVAAAVSAFVLGGIWYGPLFLKAWSREAGIDVDANKRHPAQVFGVAFLAALVSAAVFAWWLGPAPALQAAACKGLAAGLGIAAMSFAINYSFAGRSFRLWLIDGGYHTLQFLLYGIILGIWH